MTRYGLIKKKNRRYFASQELDKLRGEATFKENIIEEYRFLELPIKGCGRPL